MTLTRDSITGQFRPASFPETQEWKSWKDVKPEQWPWTHFSPEEIACRGTGKLIVHTRAMDRLEALRVKLGKPIILNSAYRSPEHNKRVGGEANSYHMAQRKNATTGEMVMAFDCSMENHEPYEFERMAKEVGLTGIGHYPKTKDGRHNFMHVDNGPTRTWQSAAGRFPKPSEKPREVPKRFDAEVKVPTLTDIVKKVEVAGPVAATVLTGTGATTVVQDPANPITWVAAAILLVGAIAVGYFVFTKFRGKTAVVTPGTGD